MLILNDVQYIQNLVFSFEKRFKRTKSLLVRFPPAKFPQQKKIPPVKFPIPLQRGFSCLPLNTIQKTLMMGDIHLSPKLKKYVLINAFYVYIHQNVSL